MSDVNVGERFGHLEVTETGITRYAPHKASGGRIKGEKAARVQCDCGREYFSLVKNLTSKAGIESCRSCRKAKADTRKALALAWANAIQRSTNPASRMYHRYGGRGIRMFEPWRINKDRFIAEAYEILGDRPEGYSLDRIDNDGDYAPHNIRWADRSTQVRNRNDYERVGNRINHPAGPRKGAES